MGAIRAPVLIYLWAGALDHQTNERMLKNLWSKGGCTPTRIFSIPCLKSKIVTKNGVASQEVAKVQEIHALEVDDLEFFSSCPDQHLEEIQEPWTIVDEEQPFELEIEDILACLSPDTWFYSESDGNTSEEV